ncbi:rubredoxin [Sphaerotilus natans]|uniref:rubredoxin n=1 Tax=Sphaerotilus natans TaxID=34103 RepID=UPI00406C364E
MNTSLATATHLCTLCHFVYDEEVGRPEDGIEPGTPWAAVPEDWCCPECGAGKEDFRRTDA